MFYAVLLCGFLLTTGPVIRVVPIAGMSEREGKSSGAHDNEHCVMDPTRIILDLFPPHVSR